MPPQTQPESQTMETVDVSVIDLPQELVPYVYTRNCDRPRYYCECWYRKNDHYPKCERHRGYKCDSDNRCPLCTDMDPSVFKSLNKSMHYYKERDKHPLYKEGTYV